MKKVLLFVLIISTISYAGFFGSMVGGAIGATAGGGSGSPHLKTRMNKINAYLWNMHKSGIYSKDYKFYLKYLEKSDAIGDLDTTAWVYKDNGNKKKAIEIYKTRILPWVKIEDSKTQVKYKRFFQEISDEVKIRPKQDGRTSKQQCIQSGGNWSWNSKANKWVCLK